jgi:hypothetical protein
MKVVISSSSRPAVCAKQLMYFIYSLVWMWIIPIFYNMYNLSICFAFKFNQNVFRSALAKTNYMYSFWRTQILSIDRSIERERERESIFLLYCVLWRLCLFVISNCVQSHWSTVQIRSVSRRCILSYFGRFKYRSSESRASQY